jgi:hypothetical protein
VFENCSTKTGGGGGAIKGNKITLKNCIFGKLVNDEIDTGKKCWCSGGSGGAVAASSDLVMENCSFYGCTSTSAGGAVYSTGNVNYTNNSGGEIGYYSCTATSDGGAIYQTSGANGITINNISGTMMFKNNTSSSSGGGLRAIDKDITINNSSTLSFINCTANYGGAINNNNNTLTVNNSGTLSFNNCRANYNGAVWTGIFRAENNSGEITFNNCGKQGTRTDTKGGAIIVNKSASGTDTLIINNTSDGSFVINECNADAGGGIYVTNGNANISSENNSSPILISGCSAITTTGGGIHVVGNLNMTNSKIISSTAKTLGGAIYINGTGTFTDCEISSCQSNDSTSGGAINVAASSNKLYFAGDTFVYNNIRNSE